MPEEVTTTVVGARAAKTTRAEICYTGEGVLEVDVKLLEGGEERERRDPPPPMCQTPKDEVPLDARLMRLLIFLFKVQRLHNPPAQCRMDMETTWGAVGPSFPALPPLPAVLPPPPAPLPQCNISPPALSWLPLLPPP